MTPSPFLSPNNEPILVIDYRKTDRLWHPHDLYTSGTNYNFEKDGNNDLFYMDVGSGKHDRKTHEVPEFYDATKLCSKLWLAPGIAPIHNGKPITRAQARKLGVQIVSHPITGDPFGDAEDHHGHMEYCIQCKCHWRDDAVCGHLHYEEGQGHTLGCGSSDCDYAATLESLYSLLRLLPGDAIELLRKALRSGKYRSQTRDSMLGGDYSLTITPGPLTIQAEQIGEQHKYEERFWPGFAWLQSLDPTCKEAIALTLGWVWAWQQTGWRDHCIAPATRLFRDVTSQEMDAWLAIDPHCPALLYDRTKRIPFLRIKPKSQHDTAFLRDAAGTREVTFHHSTKRKHRSITLSVAEVVIFNQPCNRCAELHFGSILERNGQHISQIEGYTLVST